MKLIISNDKLISLFPKLSLIIEFFKPEKEFEIEEVGREGALLELLTPIYSNTPHNNWID